VILTVTLNPCVDRIYSVPDFRVGEIHRVMKPLVRGGGKGVNVARTLRFLGGEVHATGFLGGLNGEYIRDELQKGGIGDFFLTVQEETRNKIAITDTRTGEETEINEPGPMVAEEQDKFLSHLDTLVRRYGYSYVAFCGSLPQGANNDFYFRCVELVQSLGVKCAVDTSGEALKRSVEAKPWIVKPNRAELSEMVNAEIETNDDILKQCHAILESGVGNIVVTLGSRGAVYINEDGAWIATPPMVTVVHSLGSGDAFLAGMLRGFEMNLDPPDSLKLAMATAAIHIQGARPEDYAQQQISKIETDVTIDRVCVGSGV
jgi:1-phosphofructokinase family hexose kinase